MAAEQGVHHRMLAGKTVLDEDSFGLVAPNAQGRLQLRRELRAARGMAVAALALAVVSSALLAVIAARLFDEPASRLQGNVQGAVGLYEGGVGWYRTYLRTMVREGRELDSKPLHALPMGSLVYVSEVRGRRAHVVKPLEGWMSMRTEEGVDILMPDRTYYGNPEDDSDSEKYIVHSRRVREANARMQAGVAKLTAVQQQIVDTIVQLNSKQAPEHLGKKSQELGEDFLRQHVPRVQAEVTRTAQDAIAKAAPVAPPPEQIARGARDFLQRFAQEPRVRSFFESSPVVPRAAELVQADNKAIAMVADSLHVGGAKEGQRQSAADGTA